MRRGGGRRNWGGGGFDSSFFLTFSRMRIHKWVHGWGFFFKWVGKGKEGRGFVMLGECCVALDIRGLVSKSHCGKRKMYEISMAMA
jgi:hypothetical protein